LGILAVIELYSDCGVRMVNPMANVPRTNLVSAFQGLQSGRKPTNPENSLRHRECNDIWIEVYHLNDILCAASAVRWGSAC
jgi:hypothetical protein